MSQEPRSEDGAEPTDQPQFGCGWRRIDGQLICVEVTLYRPEGITTSWVRTLPIATLIQRRRRQGFESGNWTRRMTISDDHAVPMHDHPPPA